MKLSKHFLSGLIAAQAIGCGTSKTESSNQRSVSTAAAVDTHNNAPSDAKPVDAVAANEADGVKLSSMEVAPLEDSAQATAARPAAPASIKLSKSGRDVSILWASVRGAKTYQVVRSIDGATRKIIALTPSTPYKDKNVPPGSSVTYWIATVAPTGSVSVASKAVSVKIFSSAPANVTATATDGSVRIGWTASHGATNYLVYYKGPTDSIFRFAASTSSTSAVPGSMSGVSGLYSFYVVAENSGGKSPNSQIVTATLTAPAAPNLGGYYVDATHTSYPHVRLDWDEVPGTSSYRVQWSSNNYGWTDLGSTIFNSYEDRQFPTGGIYYSYRVKAIAKSGLESQYSNVVQVLVAPLAPSNVTAQFSSNTGNVIVRWQTSSNYGPISYKIYRRDYYDSTTYYWIGSSNSASYTDYQVTANKTYYYAVTASNSAGESETSSPVYVTIPQYTYNTCDSYYSDTSCSGRSVNAACGGYTGYSCRATSTLGSGLSVCSCTNYSGFSTLSSDPSAPRTSVVRRAP